MSGKILAGEAAAGAFAVPVNEVGPRSPERAACLIRRDR
jgi:hypothetical protein